MVLTHLIYLLLHVLVVTCELNFTYGDLWFWVVAGASSLRPVIPNGCLLKSSGAFYKSSELNMVLSSVLKLQRWWRGLMLLKLRTKSAVTIQSHTRGWIDRQKATREKQCTVVIQVRHFLFIAVCHIIF